MLLSDEILLSAPNSGKQSFTPHIESKGHEESPMGTRLRGRNVNLINTHLMHYSQINVYQHFNIRVCYMVEIKPCKSAIIALHLLFVFKRRLSLQRRVFFFFFFFAGGGGGGGQFFLKANWTKGHLVRLPQI